MVESKNIVVEKTPAAAAAKAAGIFKSVVSDAIERDGVCYLALAGGTTPHAMYQHLAREAVTDKVPWSKVEVFFGDERDVPQDDVESNFAMVQRTLLDNAPIDWSRVHPMRADAEDIEAAACEYEQTIRETLPVQHNGVPRFDMVMLGLGGDGHLASLFPGCPALNETEKMVVTCFVPVLGRHRMTFTFPLINASRNIMMLVTGDDKAEVVRRVIEKKDPSLPAARLLPVDGAFHIVLDAAAARLL